MGPVNCATPTVQPQPMLNQIKIKEEPHSDYEPEPAMVDSQGQGLPPSLVNQTSGLPTLEQSNPSSIDYNVVTVKWNRVPPIERLRSYNPMPRHGHRAVSFNQYILVFGGGNEGIFSEVMIFDTSRREWYKPPVQGDIPRGRAAFGMVLHEEQQKILVFGGMLEHGHLTNDMYELNISKWIWKRLMCTGHPEDYYRCPRMGHSFTLIGDTAYVFGGLRNNNIAGPHKLLPEYLNDLPTFHMSTDPAVPDGLWKNQITFGLKPSPRESHSAVAYSSKDGGYNKLIIFGGMHGFRLGDLHVLDVDTLMWSKMETMSFSPLPRSLHSACLVGVRMYVFGGWLEMVPGEQNEPKDNNNLANYERWKVTNDLTCLNVETMTWELVNWDAAGLL